MNTQLGRCAIDPDDMDLDNPGPTLQQRNQARDAAISRRINAWQQQRQVDSKCAGRRHRLTIRTWRAVQLHSFACDSVERDGAVVIGGIISSTFLTLVVLPALYRLAYARGPEANRSVSG